MNSIYNNSHSSHYSTTTLPPTTTTTTTTLPSISDITPPPTPQALPDIGNVAPADLFVPDISDDKN